MRSNDIYQYTLIAFACVLLAGVGIFTYREVFPEYKVYQSAYVDLEEFRAGYSHETPAPFSKGIKQLVLSSDHSQKESLDRCISCHVAMDLPHFSKTRIAKDLNNKILIDEKGVPILEANPDYVFEKLDARIQELTHPAVLAELSVQGKKVAVKARLKEAENLRALKFVEVDGREISVEKVLQMHPLIGSETRPFEHHPLETYGCCSCHSGNGRSLVAQRAHGPVFDGEYEPSHGSHKPQFLESDPVNGHFFSRMYNDKPGHALIFQTTPILANHLVEAKCVQCHSCASGSLQSAIDKFSNFAHQKQKQLKALSQRLEADGAALAALKELRDLVETQGRLEALDFLRAKRGLQELTTAQMDALEGQIAYLSDHEEILAKIECDLESLVASTAVTAQNLSLGQKAMEDFENSQEKVTFAVQDKEWMQKMGTNIDPLISHYQRGKELFISQGCYGCHRIAGFSRNNVGPELTLAGLSYPWYIKESIVWPQADLPTSIMPNFCLDHEELADLMTFLMAQTPDIKSVSEVDYQMAIIDWEKGAKMPWEEPVKAGSDAVALGKMIFATEGCASCHKLEGFSSNLDIKSKSWFEKMFPEHISGSDLAKTVQACADQIDQNLVPDSSKNNILEAINDKDPKLLSTFYPQFKWAARALSSEDQERLCKVLFAYIQTYGLGRDIAPKLNWSGVWRDDEWLLGHFHNPGAYTAKSLMPVMPFDDSKFYILQEMLHVVGKQNQEKLARVWRTDGFDPPKAYQMLCSSCHGDYRQGNGPLAQWIFPIPKNLRNPLFLQHLTKERAIHSITHGVKGTPMPPWGEATPGQQPVLNAAQIAQLVEWLYQDVPQKSIAAEKWAYSPSDVTQEIFKENKFDAEGCFEKTSKGDFISEKFYTTENLNAGKEFFVMNCSVCHGKEGAGTGIRASSMVEAKPRVLTDTSWIRSEDDMGLLRAIKYGVPGTAMAAWGDQTTSLQRMQLACFIRSLSQTALHREELQSILYTLFQSPIHHFSQREIEPLQPQLHALKTALTRATNAEEAGRLYSEIYLLETEIKKEKQVEELQQKILLSLKEERKIFESIGELICAEHLPLAKPYFETLKKIDLASPLNTASLLILFEEPLLSKIAPQIAEAALLHSQRHQLSGFIR